MLGNVNTKPTLLPSPCPTHSYTYPFPFPYLTLLLPLPTLLLLFPFSFPYPPLPPFPSPLPTKTVHFYSNFKKIPCHHSSLTSINNPTRNFFSNGPVPSMKRQKIEKKRKKKKKVKEKKERKTITNLTIKCHSRSGPNTRHAKINTTISTKVRISFPIALLPFDFLSADQKPVEEAIK